MCDDWYAERFDLYGALWMFCNRFYGGQGSRGYRILSRLSRAGYSPSLSVRENRFESEEQRAIYRDLLKYRRTI